MPHRALIAGRTLGDRLYTLKRLCEADVRAIEAIVDRQIKLRATQEYERVLAASKARPLPFRR